LTSEQARARLAEHGPNVLRSRESPHWLARFALKQLNELCLRFPRVHQHQHASVVHPIHVDRDARRSTSSPGTRTRQSKLFGAR